MHEFLGEQRKNAAAAEAFPAVWLRFAFSPLLLFEFAATRFSKILSINASRSLLVHQICSEYPTHHDRVQVAFTVG